MSNNALYSFGDLVGDLNRTDNEFFEKEMSEEVEKQATYSQSSVFVGWNVRTSGQEFVDISTPYRAFYFGRTRTGKTLAIRSFTDRLRMAGLKTMAVPDLKDEFHSSKRSGQEKFSDIRREGEDPTGFNMQRFRPTFFRVVENVKNVGDGEKWYSPDLNEMTRADLKMLVKANEFPRKQSILFRELLDVLDNDNVVVTSVSDLRQLIFSELDEDSESQLEDLWYKLKPLEMNNVFEYDKRRNFPAVLNAGMHPILDMEGYEAVAGGKLGLAPTHVTFVIREVVNALRASDLDRVTVVIDEAARFMGRNVDMVSKDFFKHSFDVDTAAGISYIGATQFIKDVPEAMLEQCRYLWVPYNASTSMMQTAMDIGGVVSNVYKAKQEANQKLQELSQYEWCLIDTDLNRTRLIQPAGPLSWHQESD